MRFPNKIARAAGLLLGLLVLGALPVTEARAEKIDRAYLSLLSGSERLRLRAFGQALSARQLRPREVERMKSDMVRQGYYLDGFDLRPVATDLWVAPVLSWDSNINGGVRQDKFWLNGLLFEADPAYRAKKGMVGGAAAGGVARIAWDNGRLLEFGAQGEAAWSPDYNLWRTDTMLSVCSRNHVAGWSFLDLCSKGMRSTRELGNSSAYEHSISYSQVVSGADSLHELGLTLSRFDSVDQARQNRATVSVESIWNKLVTDISFTKGQDVPDETVLDWRIDLGASWYWAGRAWEVQFWRQNASGSYFLGVPRHDESVGIAVAADIRPGITLRLGYARNESTAGIANYDQVMLDVKFNRLRW